MGLPPWCLLIVAVGLGFAHGGGDRGLLHLVLIVLTVDWCYSLSTFFWCVDGRLWDATGGGVRCVQCSSGGLVVMVVTINLWSFYIQE